MQVDAAEVDDVRVVRIDADLAEVHRARIGVVHLRPRLAGVGGLVEAGGIVVDALTAPAATPAALLLFLWALDDGVENVRVLAIHVERDAAERAVEHAAFQLRPRLAAVGGLEDAAARAAAVEAARGAPAL